MPKGTYTFRVRAKQRTVSDVAECSYTFTILPAWYETNVAYGIYALLVLLLLGLLVFLIRHQFQKAAKKVERQKEVELQEQEKRFEAEAKDKEKEIMRLKNQRLEYELRHKSQELVGSTMNLVRKNDMLASLTEGLSKLSNDIKEEQNKKNILKDINRLVQEVKRNIGEDDNWKRFEENFDIVYQDYLKRLSERFPELSLSDKKLCAYLRMGLTSKDIASLLDSTIRSVETNRYRLRRKLELDRDANLSDFLQRF